MKLFCIVQYNQYGQPYRFYSWTAKAWQTEMHPGLFSDNKNFMDKLADEVSGFVETYKVEREVPKITREQSSTSWAELQNPYRQDFEKL